jgi:vacuolar-type H+-ATPase subunit I/STV1
MLTAIGLFELSYGFVVRSLRNWKKFGPALVIGILGFLFSIVLYLASLATPLPLSVPQQTITLISVVPFIAKILEAIFITSAANLLRAK